MNNKIFYLFFPSNHYSVDDINFIKNLLPVNTPLEVVTELTEDIKIDLIYFTGGSDVNPEEYGENTGKFTYVDKKRDELEKNNYFRFLFSNTPKLGICRGAQFLTVMNGGKLIQHVTGHTSDHTIILLSKDKKPLKTLNMTSSHHQMMYPFGLKKEQYELIGISKYFRSNTYLNGNNQETRLNSDFLEPEIVYYPDTNSLCIQGHPEWMPHNSETVQYINNIIKTKLFKDEI
jgi:gamma-glutamyl-gamma-aminobutyrate hydrolase PuuD